MLKPFQIRSINAFQRLQMERLVLDRAHAIAASRSLPYGRIGEWLMPVDNRARTVLELGCGPGRFVAVLAQLGYRVVGVDLHDFPTWELVKRLPDVELHRDVSADALPFPDASFDAVVCMGALLYFSDDHAALAEMYRVLKPGGRLVVRTPNARNFYTSITGRKLDPSSHHLYTEPELRERVASAGFRVCQSFSYGFWPPFATDQYWFLVNGWVPQMLQSLLSALTPPGRRINISIFAVRGVDGEHQR